MTITTLEPLDTINFLTISSLPSGYRYALIFVNHFIKFSVVILTNDQMSPTTAKLFWEHVIQPYSCHKWIYLDQNPKCETVIMSKLCRLSGTRKSQTTLYHPQGNEACELLNFTLMGMLQTLKQGH